MFGLHLVLVCAVSFVFSTNSLAFSDNRVFNEISANGVSSLFKAFRTNDLDFSRHYRTLEDEEAFSLIRRQLTRGGGSILGSEPRDLNRFFLPEAHGLGRMNVVVIVEESFGAGYLGSYGDTRGLSPNFDRLASKGLRFANAFATGTRTVRGLEAISASFPPIPSESIIKRPGSEGIANWGKVMGENGYNTSFFYGGYGYFDNMNHFFANNGFAISDRSDISEPAFANIWGVSDEDLFDHALAYFDGAAAKGEPFFSIIMTTSNHKPYAFPEGIPGVALGGGGRRDGIRYADYALGRFFENAPQHEWFDNTLFVVVADHDSRVYGRAQVPVDRYRIPLLLYAPKVVAPGTVATATSQIDIAPTVLGMLGLPYSAPFYGQNVLAADPDAPRPILLNHNHDVALLEGSDMVVLGLQESVDYFRYDETSHQLAPAEENLSLRDRAVAYYQTAFELFKNHGYE